MTLPEDTPPQSVETNATRVVLARKSYDHLIRTRDRALRQAEWERECAEHVRAWAGQAFDEQRRLSDRLTAVVAAAASLGVSLDAINRVLDATGKPVIHEPRCNSNCRPNSHLLTSGVGFPHIHRTDLAAECGECVNPPGEVI